MIKLQLSKEKISNFCTRMHMHMVGFHMPSHICPCICITKVHNIPYTTKCLRGNFHSFTDFCYITVNVLPVNTTIGDHGQTAKVFPIHNEYCSQTTKVSPPNILSYTVLYDLA